MIRKLIFLVFVVALIIVGVGIYLQPDSLAGCGRIPDTDNNCQPVDAIVAISGGDTTARANEAITLFKNGWSNLIIFSGAAEDKTGPSNAAVMEQLAIESGVPEASIVLDENANTTQENAKNTQAIFTKLSIKKIILVTSGYHQRRASLEFNKLAQGVVILNHPVQTDKDWSFWWWTTPHGWWLAGSEIAKIIAFHVAGIWS